MTRMLILVRHAFAVLVLPFMVVFVIPRWLVNGYGVVTQWPSHGFEILGQVAGGFFIAFAR